MRKMNSLAKENPGSHDSFAVSSQEGSNLQIVKNKVLDEDQAIIEYGIQQGKMLLVGIAIAITIGAVFQVFWQGILFLTAFIPLRMYAGGYHADTQQRCNVISFAAICICFGGMRFWDASSIQVVMAATIALLVILLLAPVENDNKRLEEIEIRVYRKRTRVVALAEYGVLWLTVGLHMAMAGEAITMAFILVAVCLVAGRVKDNRKNRK